MIFSYVDKLRKFYAVGIGTVGIYCVCQNRIQEINVFKFSYVETDKINCVST